MGINKMLTEKLNEAIKKDKKKTKTYIIGGKKYKLTKVNGKYTRKEVK